MNKNINVLVLRDEDGELRPMAGIWKDDDHGRVSAEIFLGKKENKNLSVVKCQLIEN